MNVFFKHKAYVLKHFCRFVLVFFALMPCAVKNTLFLKSGFEPAGILHVSKVPVSGSENCSVYTRAKEHYEVVHITRHVGADTQHALPAYREVFFSGSADQDLYHAANAPPLYILYKRLKIAVAV